MTNSEEIPRVQKIKNALSFRWWTAIHDRWAVIIFGLFGIASPIVTEYFRGSVQWLYLFMASAPIVSVCCIGVVIGISREAFRSKDKMLTAVQEAAIHKLDLHKLQDFSRELSSDYEKIHMRYKTIANQFGLLIKSQCEYESKITKHVSSLFGELNSLIEKTFTHPEYLKSHIGLASEKINELDKEWSIINDDWNSIIQNICNYAVIIIETKKGKPDRCSTNIKGLVRGDDPSYFVRKRSIQGRNQKREAADAVLFNNPIPVRLNRMYNSIVNGVKDEGRMLKNRQNPYCLINDIEEYIKETEIGEQNFQLSFIEPTKVAIEYYSSCLIVPIRGSDYITNQVNQDDVTVMSGDNRILGFICIDSKDKNYFDDGYDLDIMTQLANHAFAIIRTHFWISKLRQSILSSLTQHKDIPI